MLCAIGNWSKPYVVVHLLKFSSFDLSTGEYKKIKDKPVIIKTLSKLRPLLAAHFRARVCAVSTSPALWKPVPRATFNFARAPAPSLSIGAFLCTRGVSEQSGAPRTHKLLYRRVTLVTHALSPIPGHSRFLENKTTVFNRFGLVLKIIQLSREPLIRISNLRAVLKIYRIKDQYMK